MTSRPAEARADYAAARRFRKHSPPNSRILRTIGATWPEPTTTRASSSRRTGNARRRSRSSTRPSLCYRLLPTSRAPVPNTDSTLHGPTSTEPPSCTDRKAEEARDDCSRAIALLDGLASADPLKPDYRYELAIAHANRGNALAQLRRAEAEKDYRESLRVFGGLAADFPRVPAYRAEQANTWNSLAALLAAKRPDEAEKCWGGARDLLRTLIEDFPQQATYHGDLGMTLSNLGRLHLKQGQPKEAVGCLEDGIRELEIALGPDPARSDYVESLRRTGRPWRSRGAESSPLAPRAGSGPGSVLPFFPSLPRKRPRVPRVTPQMVRYSAIRTVAMIDNHRRGCTHRRSHPEVVPCAAPVVSFSRASACWFFSRTWRALRLRPRLPQPPPERTNSSRSATAAWATSTPRSPPIRCGCATIARTISHAPTAPSYSTARAPRTAPVWKTPNAAWTIRKYPPTWKCYSDRACPFSPRCRCAFSIPRSTTTRPVFRT